MNDDDGLKCYPYQRINLDSHCQWLPQSLGKYPGHKSFEHEGIFCDIFQGICWFETATESSLLHESSEHQTYPYSCGSQKDALNREPFLLCDSKVQIVP